MASPLARFERAALGMLAAWMGEHYFRTFRILDEDDAAGAAPFDALLAQRDRRAGVTIGTLWPEGEAVAVPGFEALVGSDIDEGGYVLWSPPGIAPPSEEPALSDFRLRVANGLKGLEPNERRELRIPITLQLAKTEVEGQYVSVTGGLSSHWTAISEGVSGAFHLDSRTLHRLPEEEAELEIVLSRVRDRAGLLNKGERSAVEVHDYWLVSRLPADDPPGLTVAGARPDFDPSDGATVRRLLRRNIKRAVEQREAGSCDLAVLVLVSSVAHMEDEMATTALKGMNPAAYAPLDLIALVADGRVRQVLQPRSLPWEAA
ncbi:MAG: hypothetical protein V3R95_08805 [Dehalococcoidia bacterium]